MLKVKKYVTIEGLLKDGELNHVQKAFIEKDGLQCGFCTPGQIMAAYALLKKNPNPSREDAIKGMSWEYLQMFCLSKYSRFSSGGCQIKINNEIVRELCPVK